MRIIRGFSSLLVLAMAGWTASAATLTWTNTIGGSWSIPQNWDPNVVPGAGDTAVINRDGTYVIIADASGELNSLALGGGSGTQTLVLTQNGLSCTGNIAVSNGAVLEANGFVQAQQIIVSGTMNWDSGFVGSGMIVATNGVLNITGDSIKTLAAGAGLTNYGLVEWSGVGGINAQDYQYSPGHPVVANMASGVFEINNDSILQLNAYMYDPSLAFVFVNNGTLRKLAGSGLTIFNNAQFANNGTVDVQQGTLQFANGGSGFFSSAGLFTIAAGASVELNGGTCTFLPGHQAQGQGVFGLGVNDMPVTLQGQLAGRFDWSGGMLQGQWTVATNGVLNITGDSIKTLAAGAGLTNYGFVEWTGVGGINAQDYQFSSGHPMIANMASGVFEISNDSILQLNTFIYDPSLAFVFVNDGIVRKIAGSGATIFDNLQFINSGTLEVSSGSLEFGSPGSNGTQWEDSGIIRLAVSSATDFTSIQSFGSADLSGQLDVVFENGYQPSGGDSFELLTFASANVSLSNINLPEVTAGLYLAALADSNHVVVTVRQDPVANSDSFTLNEDAPVDLNVLANDNNLYGAGTIISFTQPSHGVLSLNSDNTLHYVPATHYSGGDAFTYQARNADGKVASAGVTLQILTVNHPPELAPLVDRTVDEGTLLTFAAQASDVDGNQLTFTLGFGAPVGASIQPVTGVFAWTPTEAQGPAVYPITVIVTDNGSPSLSVSLTFNATVREVNTAPVLNPISNQTIPEAQPFSLQLSATDSDIPANTLTFYPVSVPSGLALSSAGLVTWTPTEAQGPSTNLVTVAVRDNGQPSLSATQSFQIVVSEINTAPILPIQTNQFVVDELTLLVITNTATDSDLPANVLTYTLLNAPAGASIDTNGIITWTPTEAQGPSSNLLVSVVTDNGQPPLSATNSIVVLVNEVNSAPVLTAILPQTVDEMTPFSLQALATDPDLPANHLTFSLVSGPPGLSVSPSGLISWTPTEAQGPGVYSVTLSVSDDGTPSLSSTQTFSITVNEVNLPPSLAPVSPQSVAELTAFNLQLSANDPDLPANQLTFDLVSGPAGLSVSPGGLVSWTPTEAQGPSTNQVVVRVGDDGVPSLSATQSFSIVVTEVNSAPVLNAVANQTIPETQPFSLQLSATDSDIPANTLTFYLVSGPSGLAVSSFGMVTWTPSEAQGPSTNLVTVAVKDDGQPSLSATQSFQIVVSEINTPPILPIQTNQFVVNELTLLVVTNTATDSDLPANLLTYTLLNAPAGASIDTNGIITWTPTEAQGPSSNLLITVVTDSGQPPLSATNSFVVLVNEVNLPPSLAPVSPQSVAELTAFNLQLSANDPDLPANQLTFGLVSGPAGLSVSPGGLVSWTPTEAQGPSTNQVVVRVGDDGVPSLSATQSFSIAVTEVNSAPVLGAIADQTILPAQTLSLAFSASDSDIPANTLTFSLDSAPAGATVTTDGHFAWAPTFDQAGSTNTVIVRVTDNGVPSLSSSQAFSILVPNTGLKGDYFAGTNFETLVLTRDDAGVNFDWSTGSPGPGIPTNQFSVRWTGQVIPRYSQTYTFYTVSDDGVRLWVDGQNIINNWTVHLATTNTATIALTAGQAYMLRLEYFDASGGAVSRFMWSSTSQTKEFVPASQLLCKGYSDLVPNGIYRFTPELATGRCLEVANGATADGSAADIKDWKASSSQKWQAVALGSNYFKLIPQNALTKVLELNGGFTTNGTKIQIATDNGTARQRFQFIDLGQGWFKIQPQPSPNSVLDLKGGSSANGTAVQLNQDQGTTSEQWRLDRQ